MKTITNISLMFAAFVLFVSNITMTDLLIKKQIYEVNYSQKLEQPLWLSYESTNRPTNVNRGSMDFYTEKILKLQTMKIMLKTFMTKVIWHLRQLLVIIWRI